MAVSVARPERVDTTLRARYGRAAVTLCAAMRRACPEELVDPVIASVLPDAAETVIRLCRKAYT